MIAGLLIAGYNAPAEENPMSTESNSTRIIFDFGNKKEADQWMAVNDSVMGGISEGQPLLDEDGHLVFSGSISLANNGGFSSIRTIPLDFGLEGYEGIRIRVKGDGRTYQFRLRTNKHFDGVAFKQEFATKAGAWIEIDLPFASFLPSFRGKILQDVDPLVAADIRQLGFLIADRTAGPFNLIIDEIKAYR